LTVIDAVELSLHDSGPRDGCPVVLLHGGSSSAATWARLTASLPERRVIAPDLRGHGSSPRCESYPLDGYVADVVAVLDRLGLDRVPVVGHSLGGYVAGRLAMERPDRVTRLVLEEPPVPPRSAPRPARRLNIVQLAVGSLRHRGFELAAVRSAISQLRQPDPAWWDGLGRITAPTLVISGGPRSHIAPDEVAEMTRAMADGRLVTIAAGHRVHSTKPAEFAAVVVPFLDNDAR
jgi:pimeloyl-ACP methyl ester carboxylesterase